MEIRLPPMLTAKFVGGYYSADWARYADGTVSIMFGSEVIDVIAVSSETLRRLSDINDPDGTAEAIATDIAASWLRERLVKP